jgi:CheY-like chemotaxis protein
MPPAPVVDEIMPTTPPDDRDDRPGTVVSAEGFASALSDPIRRTVLFHLKNERRASFDDLIGVTLATHPPRTPAMSDDEKRSAIGNALFHLHLPKLEMLGVVDWEPETGVVALRADPDRLTDWLDVSFSESVHGATESRAVYGTESSGDIAVLFVEDYEELASLVVEQFEANHADITVTTASNAEAALEALESSTFDCIVSDYDMPGSNGIDFLKAIRRVDESVPFVIYTGKGTDGMRTKAADYGANAYLQKSGGVSQYDLLADRIRQVVADHRGDAATGV